MNKNRIANLFAIAVALLFMVAMPGPARGFTDQHPAGPPSRPVPAGEPVTRNAQPGDDFEGLDYTDDQKAQIAKIRQEADAKKAVVAKDDKLTPDQKDAMVVGYTRLEYGQIYRALTPAQQKVVRQRINARKAADQGAKKPQHPGN
jgi:Spy/CpxP family protein refolding chaperone